MFFKRWPSLSEISLGFIMHQSESITPRSSLLPEGWARVIHTSTSTLGPVQKPSPRGTASRFDTTVRPPVSDALRASHLSLLKSQKFVGWLSGGVWHPQLSKVLAQEHPAAVDRASLFVKARPQTRVHSVLLNLARGHGFFMRRPRNKPLRSDKI